MIKLPKKHYPYLAFAGAIPFVASACLLLLGIEQITYFGNVVNIMSTYGLTIISFMAGSHWGTHLSLDERKNTTWIKYLPVMSNAITLAAWFGYLLLPARITLIVMAILFLSLLIIEAKLKENNVIDSGYYNIRCWVSKIVIASLCISSVMVA